MWSFEVLCLAALSLSLLFGLGIQAIGPSEYRRRLRRYLNGWPGPVAVTFTGTTSAATTITAVTNINNLKIGMLIVGTNIPPATHIVSINSALDQISTDNTLLGVMASVHITAYDTTQNVQVHLAAAAMSPGNDPTPASFTEATFDTYAPIVPTGTEIFSNPDNSSESDFGDLAWVLTTTPVTGNLIYGYWIDYLDTFDGVTRVVSCWEAFPSPIPMQSAGNAVVFTLPITFPDPGSAVIL
jgi:hypothetical protein